MLTHSPWYIVSQLATLCCIASSDDAAKHHLTGMMGQMAVQLHASPSVGAAAGDPQGPGFADSLYPLDASERKQSAETRRFPEEQNVPDITLL